MPRSAQASSRKHVRCKKYVSLSLVGSNHAVVELTVARGVQWKRACTVFQVPGPAPDGSPARKASFRSSRSAPPATRGQGFQPPTKGYSSRASVLAAHTIEKSSPESALSAQQSETQGARPGLDCSSSRYANFSGLNEADAGSWPLTMIIVLLMNFNIPLIRPISVDTSPIHRSWIPAVARGIQALEAALLPSPTPPPTSTPTANNRYRHEL